jgi:hypothetical protein
MGRLKLVTERFGQTETVEEFLARSGQITKLPPGHANSEEPQITAQQTERLDSFYELDVDPEMSEAEKNYENETVAALAEVKKL